ncbi:MAG: hypothetical protein AAF432_04085 [Planctomycetota bacterium]
MFQQPFTADWHNTTTLHPLAMALTAALAALIFVLPRRHALIPLVIAACFIAPAQRVVLLTMDFTMLRVLLLAGCARVMLRGEIVMLRWKLLDTLMVAWCVAGVLTYSIQYASFGMFVQKLGFTYDAAGMYFLCRFLVRDWDDLIAFTTNVILISAPVTVFLLVEKTTGRNIFSVFGGVPEYTRVREGRLRVQGAFGHPILLGCFWAAMLPLIVALVRHHSWRRYIVPLGVVTSMTAAIVTASSTPWLVLLITLMAILFYPFRRWTPWVRWAGCLGLVSLHLVMLKPVWHLIARVDVVSGSTGWYRYKLIDEFFNHFGDWWLFGTHDYVNWYTYGFEAVTNQYIFEGVNGGLITLALFIAIIVEAYRALGHLQRRVLGDPIRSAFAWAIGVSLFVHVVSFIAVAYTGQIRFVWFFALAVAATFQPARRAAHAPMFVRIRKVKDTPEPASVAVAEPTTS